MKTFLKCSQKVHVHKIEDRKPSETVGIRGNCRNVRKFPNKYKEISEKGISLCIFKFILTIFNNGKLIELKIDGELAFASAQKWYYT